MKSEKGVELVLDAVSRALEDYSSDKVDAVVNEETGKVDIIYHSTKHSFTIESGVADAERIDMTCLAKRLDEIGVGHCW